MSKPIAELMNKIYELICENESVFRPKIQTDTVKLHEPTFFIKEALTALEVILSSNVTMGNQVKRFELNSARKFNSRSCIMSNSGSSANLLAIAALSSPLLSNHLQPGDEVIVPALAWSTTVWPIIQYNLVPVFVDSDINTLNMDLTQVEEAIGPKTKAIMPVHVYGNPCDMNSILALAEKWNIFVIEDSCEAMGAKYDDQPVGSFGDLGTFSFYYSHHITTLEGGITLAKSEKIADIMRMIRAHGWTREAKCHNDFITKYPDIDPRFIFASLGYNLRPTELQAAIGDQQLSLLDDIVEKRTQVAHSYKNKLSKYHDYFLFQEVTTNAMHSWFGFPILLKENCPFNVKDITKYLNQNQIETRPIIAGNLTKHPVMSYYNYKNISDLKNANYIMEKGFAIGNHHAISKKNINYIAELFEQFISRL